MNIGRLSLKNNVFLAPMAGITDLPFRVIVRQFGCSLAFTEMVSANGLARGMEKSRRYLDSLPDDRPLGIQLFGQDPAVLAEAARIITDGGAADLLDLNMGCPVKKVVRAGAGAALMKSPEHISRIVKAVRDATTLPLTVKIRSGWKRNEINAPEVARRVEDGGADALIIHPRTADQGFGGVADWDVIAALSKHLKIPVVGSGDIRNPDDAQRMFDTTGCTAVMVGRAVLGYPWIFAEILARLRGESVSLPALALREALIRDHLEREIAYRGEYCGTRDFRKHLLWYTRGLRNGARFRQLMGTFTEPEPMLAELHSFFLSLGEDGEG